MSRGSRLLRLLFFKILSGLFIYRTMEQSFVSIASLLAVYILVYVPKKWSWSRSQFFKCLMVEKMD